MLGFWFAKKVNPLNVNFTNVGLVLKGLKVYTNFKGFKQRYNLMYECKEIFQKIDEAPSNEKICHK